jgi:septum formation inhibitor-activating ATPase MinD
MYPTKKADPHEQPTGPARFQLRQMLCCLTVMLCCRIIMHAPQEMLGIPLLGAIPEDQQVIISTNRGEPLVLQKKLSLSGIAFENAARRLIGKQDYFVDVQVR